MKYASAMIGLKEPRTQGGGGLRISEIAVFDESESLAAIAHWEAGTCTLQPVKVLRAS